MTKITLLSLLLSALVLTVSYASASPESPMPGVIDITQDNAKEYLSGDYNAFVEL